MPKAVAFFPWVYAESPLSVADIRLLPYHRGKLPGDSIHMLQKDLDAVLEAYALRPGAQITRATLVEVGEWRNGQDVSDEQLAALFEAREAIAFSALSQRPLFRHSFRYCNADSFRLTVQRYESGKANQFSFRTRRRDGGVDRMWSSTHFAFHCPLHVDPTRLEADERLLESLRTKAARNIYEAIVEFNAANSDASEMPLHAELVMAKSAFEWLYGVDEKWTSLWDALRGVFNALPVTQLTPLLKGADPSVWMNRWPGRTLMEAWVRDFCLARNEAAHGSGRDGKAVWHPVKHLLFVAVLFPLLVKLELRRTGGYVMDPKDLQRLGQVNGYICHDPWLVTGSEDEFAWGELDLEARMRILAETLYRVR